MTRTMLVLALALVACSPHPRTAVRALLDRGYHGIVIGDYAAPCFPGAGAEFVAHRPDGSEVRGHMCCSPVRPACDVHEVAP